MKTIKELADNLENEIKAFELVNYMMTPKCCPVCHKLITDPANLEAMFYLHECLGCDHIRTDK